MQLDLLHQKALRPVDCASAVLFRIVFGLLGLVGVIRFFVNGWIAELYILPHHHFTYLGFGWLRPWPAWGMYAHFVALGILSIFIALGYYYRWSIAGYFLAFTYVELLDQTTYLNHYYWVSLISFLMIFMPLEHRVSVDAWRKPAIRRDTVPQWVVWVLRGQLGIVYLFAGLAKVNPDWLFRGQPLRIWLFQHGGMPLAGPWLQTAAMAHVMSWGGALFDLTIVIWLLWDRTRRFGYAVLAVFHVMTGMLFPAIGLFPWYMIGGSLVFFPPGWPRRILAKWVHIPDFPSSLRQVDWDHRSPPVYRRPGWPHRLSMVGLCLLALVQLGLPLRHFAYPGNVRWNEEGYFFAWRVMLTEKVGFVEFRVRDPVTGELWRVTPDRWLSPLQAERMATQPELIRQTALFIADDFAQGGHGPVEVRVDAFVSFNGRPHARLIDPDVDLAAVKPGIAPKTWILHHDFPVTRP